jgi:hypothetical protein
MRSDSLVIRVRKNGDFRILTISRANGSKVREAILASSNACGGGDRIIVNGVALDVRAYFDLVDR